jgi:hypothetical protein
MLFSKSTIQVSVRFVTEAVEAKRGDACRYGYGSTKTMRLRTRKQYAVPVTHNSTMWRLRHYRVPIPRLTKIRHRLWCWRLLNRVFTEVTFLNSGTRNFMRKWLYFRGIFHCLIPRNSVVIPWNSVLFRVQNSVYGISVINLYRKP